VWRTNEYSAFLYRGGLVLLSLATVVVVAVAAHPGGRLGKLLGMQPLRWAGVRSYAIYLWHYPVIVLTAPSAAAGTDLPRAAVQVAATLVLAELSWRLVESPIRRGALGRLWAQVRAGAASKRTVGPRSWAALGVVPLALVLAALGLAGELPVAPHSELASNSVGISAPAVTTTSLPPASSTTVPGPPPTSAPAGTAPSTTSPSEPTSRRTTTSQPTTTSRPTTSRPHRTTTTAAPVTTHPSTSSPSTSTPGSTSEPTTTTTLPQAPLRTSCQAVVHLGDSTSESLVSSSYLPDPSQRLQAEYARVGVARSVMEIYGGNSIVETLPGEQNAYQLAKSLVDAGYRGCWVVALGTNDAADVYVGSNVGMAQRIDRMMSLIGNQPVLWVNVKTLLAAGPYSEANMQRWDDALVAACSSHPDMRVFNWAGVVQPSWYTSDGIHFNSPGSAPRAAAIADALATAFPAGAGTGAKRSGSCVVDGSPSWHLPAFKM
jgi:lysophospholipase L1-like esterase